MRTVHRTRGLGAGNILYGSVINTGFGTQVDCSDLGSWLLNSGCWGMSNASWKAINAAYMAQTYPTPPAPVTAAAPSTPAQMTGAAAWTPDMAIAQTSSDQTAQNLNFFGQVQSNVAATQGAAAAGLYDCTKVSQLFTDTSNYFANCDTTWVWVTGAAIAALFLLMGRR